MKIKKKIEITVEYNISDEISDIDFTRVENFDNFNFKHISMPFQEFMVKFHEN